MASLRTRLGFEGRGVGDLVSGGGIHMILGGAV